MNNSTKDSTSPAYHFVSDKYMFKIVRSCTLGRTRADLIIKDEKLSSLHCEFILKNSGLYVVDNESRNGTILNDKPIEPGKVHKLKVGDKLKLGSYTYIVKYGISNNNQDEERSLVSGPDDESNEEEEDSSSSDSVDEEQSDSIDSSESVPEEESVDALYEEVYGKDANSDKKPAPSSVKPKPIVRKKIDKLPTNESSIESNKDSKKEDNKESVHQVKNDFFVFKLSNLYDFFGEGELFGNTPYAKKLEYLNFYSISLIFVFAFHFNSFNKIRVQLFTSFGDVILTSLQSDYENSHINIRIFFAFALYLCAIFHAYLFRYKFNSKMIARGIIQKISLLLSLVCIWILILFMLGFTNADKIEKYSFLRFSTIALSFDDISKNDDDALTKLFQNTYSSLVKVISPEFKNQIVNDFNTIHSELEIKKVWHVASATHDQRDNYYFAGSILRDTSTHRLQGKADNFLLKMNTNESVEWVKYLGEFDFGLHSLSTVLDKSSNVYIFVGAKAAQNRSKSLMNVRHLIKYSTDGDIVWEKKFTDSDNFGSYIGSGITNSGMLYLLCKKGGDPKIDVLRFFNLDGQLKDTLEFTGNNTTNTRLVLVNDHDEIITAGTKQDLISISKRNLSGKVLLESKFTEVNPTLNSIYEDIEGHIYILGASHAAKEGSRSQIFVLKLSSDGTQSYKASFDGNKFMTFGSDILVDSKMRLIVTGADLDYSTTDLSRRYYKLVNLVFNSKLKLIKTIYGPDANASFHPNSILEDSNKTIHVFGNITDPSAVHISNPDYDFFSL